MTTIEETASSAKAYPFSRSPFSKQELLTLFLVCAFPINFWAIFIWFRNFGSVAEELGQWDAIGVGAYMLVFAMVEILVIFFVIYSLILLIPKRWRQERALAQASTLYLIMSIGLILEQSRALIEFPSEGVLWQAVNYVNNILSSSLAVILLIGAVLAVGLVVAIARSERVHSFVNVGIEKIIVLSSIYLFLDLAAVAIVIIRYF